MLDPVEQGRQMLVEVDDGLLEVTVQEVFVRFAGKTAVVAAHEAGAKIKQAVDVIETRHAEIKNRR